MRKALVFDFDGTLTRTDSFLSFVIRYIFAHPKAAIRIVPFSYEIVKGTLAGKPLRMHLKHYFATTILSNRTESDLRAFVRSYAKQWMEKHGSPLLPKMQLESTQNDVLICTASYRILVEELLQNQKVAVFGTEFETKDGRISGVQGVLTCRGPQKFEILAEWLVQNDLQKFAEIYSDNHDDLVLSEMTDSYVGVKNGNIL